MWKVNADRIIKIIIIMKTSWFTSAKSPHN